MATEASVMPRGGNFNGREKSDTGGLEVYKYCSIANQMHIVKLGEVYGLRFKCSSSTSRGRRPSALDLSEGSVLVNFVLDLMVSNFTIAVDRSHVRPYAYGLQWYTNYLS